MIVNKAKNIAHNKMEKKIFKHLTVKGFVRRTDLTTCELMEKRLDEAKAKLKNAKKDVKAAKQKLNQALEEAILKIENKKKDIKETQNNIIDDPDSSSVLSIENIKLKFEETMVELELRKNKIKKEIEEYTDEGSENWDSFKHKLNHDLEELGIALKGFGTKYK